ncbi:MAG TPA: GGDEF domain-containing protein [Solirubrobacteraceae bacterium]|nr:GGDEF domain-containing protein [Solirubrobacteraceae bacterium]
MSAVDGPRIALGKALDAAGDEIAVHALRAAAGDAEGALPEEVRERVLETHRLGVSLVSRWLVTDAEVTAEEAERLADLGTLGDAIGLGDVVKSHLAWRDAVLVAIDEAAGLLGTPRDLVEEVRQIVRRCADGTLVRMTRRFDAARRRLEASLSVERAKLAHQVLHDPLTGLPNRTLLFERVDRALVAARRHRLATALLFADLDGFKGVNDTLGHDAGDALLREVGRRLRRAVRPSDTVARLGGDEFVVLCERIADMGVAETIAERVREALARPYPLGSTTVELTASVGIASTVGDDEEAVRDLLLRADLAMYRVKHGARGRRSVSV